MHNWKDLHLRPTPPLFVLCEEKQAAELIQHNYDLFFGFAVNKRYGIVLPQGCILNVRRLSQGLILHLENAAARWERAPVISTFS